MSFLGIGFLLGLVGILLPIAIHFFGKRKKRIQPWGAMRFLEEAKPSWKRRTLRLQDLLILLLRVAAVALLALAFARPVIKYPIPSEDVHELIVIVDRSPSTNLGELKGKPIANAIIEATGKVLEEMPADTRVRLFVNGTGPGLENLPAVSGRPFNEPENRTQWIRTLKALKPATETTEWSEAIRDVVGRTDFPEPVSRRVLLVADMAKTGWPDPEDWQELAALSNLTIVPLGGNHPDRHLPNLCVERIESDQSRVQTGQQISLRARISNRGQIASQPTTVAWTESVDRIRIATRTIPRLKPGEHHEVILNKVFPEPGPAAIQAEIKSGDDALAFDNSASMVVEVIDRIRVAVVVDVHPDRMRDSGLRFDCWTFAAAAGHSASIAFGDHGGLSVPGSLDETDPFFHLSWMTPDQLDDLESSRYSVIVWAVKDARLLSDQAMNQVLQPAVARGGGLWLRLPIRVDSGAFNEAFFPHEYGLSPAGISAARQLAGKDHTIGLRPLTEKAAQVFSPAVAQTLDELQAKRHLNLSQPIPVSSEVIWDFEGGRPFLISRRFGKGQVVLTTLDSNPESGNLAASMGYVPLVRELLWQLASARSQFRNFSAGDKSAWQLLAENDRVLIPSGKWIEAGENLPHAPGLYWVEIADSRELVPVSLSGNPQESDLGELSKLELDRIGRVENIDLLDPESRADIDQLRSHLSGHERSETDEGNFETKEIRAWFLAGLIGFLLMEVIMAHHLLSRRKASLRTL